MCEIGREKDPIESKTGNNGRHQIPEETKKKEPRVQVEPALNRKSDTKMCMNMKECACWVLGSWQVFCIIASIYS